MLQRVLLSLGVAVTFAITLAVAFTRDTNRVTAEAESEESRDHLDSWHETDDGVNLLQSILSGDLHVFMESSVVKPYLRGTVVVVLSLEDAKTLALQMDSLLQHGEVEVWYEVGTLTPELKNTATYCYCFDDYTSISRQNQRRLALVLAGSLSRFSQILLYDSSCPSLVARASPSLVARASPMLTRFVWPEKLSQSMVFWNETQPFDGSAPAYHNVRWKPLGQPNPQCHEHSSHVILSELDRAIILPAMISAIMNHLDTRLFPEQVGLFHYFLSAADRTFENIFG